MEAPSTASILIVLHGNNGNAEAARTFLARNRFDRQAERDGFIVVYGNAAPSAHTSPPMVPNNGVWRQAFLNDGHVDGVTYFERALTDLETRGVVVENNPVFLVDHADAATW